MRLIVPLLIISIASFGQDSLVHYNEIEYLTEFERQAFHRYFKEKKSEVIIDLFLSTDAKPEGIRGNANERIEQLTERLRGSMGDKKKPEKQVKGVYDQVHSTFLKKYELINRFPEIFQTGYYNCVTATALYAIIFDKLNIPYSIQEKPTHVFLIAYPNQNNILVETTAPQFGYLTFDNRYKENFINTLKNQKLIGSTEVEAMGTEELFNKYFFQNENINLNQLVGIHYLNDALYYNDRTDVPMAVKQIEKAYLFHPTPRISFVMMGLVVQSLQNQKLEPLERTVLIAKASRFSAQGITSDMIKGEFLQLTEQVLTRDNNKPLYKTCFQLLKKGIDDAELKNDISYIYHYEIGRQYFNQGSYHMAKTYFSQALEFQPHNAELGGIFFSALVQSMRNERDSKTVLDSVVYYHQKFPTLHENNNFMSMLATSYVMAYGDQMDQGNALEGEKYKGKFEAMYTENKDLTISHSAISTAYSSASSYYFKKGQKTKARAALDKGLELAPGDYELRRRKQMIN